RTRRFAQAVLVDVPSARHDARAGPTLLGDPPARAFEIAAGRAETILHPHPVEWLLHDAGIGPFEALIPTAQSLLQAAAGPLRLGKMRIAMAPWADQALLRAFQAFEQAWHRVGITVLPAAHRIDRRLDGGVVLDDRAVTPVGVTMLMGKP